MFSTLAVFSILTFGPGPSPAACLEWVPVLPTEELEELYAQGKSFSDFLGGAEARTELWHGNYSQGEDIDMEQVERARMVPGQWRFLAVAVDTCSDSVSTIPYLARLVELVDNVDMRIIDSTLGKEIMESHRTPDGRAATPTVLLLNDQFGEVGCFIERPRSLQDWILENDQKSNQEIYQEKMAWYAENAGQETVEEFVAMLESAAHGEVLCGR